MRIAGIEPSMGCLKDNCFTIKQYSLFIIIFYYNISPKCSEESLPPPPPDIQGGGGGGRIM